MKHTPGPWAYDDESMQVIAPKCGYQWTTPPVIATVESLDYGESAENGRLLAAAPALLSVAIVAERRLSAQQWVTDGPVDSLPPEARELLDLRAAISQAMLGDAGFARGIVESKGDMP